MSGNSIIATMPLAMATGSVPDGPRW